MCAPCLYAAVPLTSLADETPVCQTETGVGPTMEQMVVSRIYQGGFGVGISYLIPWSRISLELAAEASSEPAPLPTPQALQYTLKLAAPSCHVLLPCSPNGVEGFLSKLALLFHQLNLSLGSQIVKRVGISAMIMISNICKPSETLLRRRV